MTAAMQKFVGTHEKLSFLFTKVYGIISFYPRGMLMKFGIYFDSNLNDRIVIY